MFNSFFNIYLQKVTPVIEKVAEPHIGSFVNILGPHSIFLQENN